MILHFVDATLSQNLFSKFVMGRWPSFLSFWKKISKKLSKADISAFIEKLSISKKMTYRPPLCPGGHKLHTSDLTGSSAVIRQWFSRWGKTQTRCHNFGPHGSWQESKFRSRLLLLLKVHLLIGIAPSLPLHHTAPYHLPPHNTAHPSTRGSGGGCPRQGRVPLSLLHPSSSFGKSTI